MAMASGRWHDWAKLQPCGTDAAYRRHIQWNEPTDAACRKAHALAVAEQRLRKQQLSRKVENER